MWNLKVVQFNNGKYGVRKGWIFHRYLDLENPRYWWPLTSQFITDCQTDNYDLAVRIAQKPKVVHG